ncbi:MAG TPA: hypothetical protein VKT77_07600 [Chthonomonadaceae bacterium]|nr:hypothetical protein [Chthonomonadaceae bacterium]
MQLELITTDELSPSVHLAETAELAPARATSREERKLAAAEFMRKLKQRRRRHQRAAARVIPPILVLTAIALALRFAHFSGAAGLSSFLLCWGSGLGMLYGLLAMLWPMLIRSASDLRDYADTAGVYAIGPLIDARICASSLKRVGETYDTITALLHQLTAADADCLTRDHREFLYEVMTGVGQIGLSTNRHERMRLAAIDAMSRVGDARALGILRRLARPSVWRRRITPVQEAALAALPLLERRMAEAASHGTLLRASAREPAGPDSLLRAAAPSAATNLDGLLRMAGP